MKYLHLVWSGLSRKKVRSILTLLSILIAFVLFGYLAAIRQGLSQGVDVAGVDRLVVRHKVSLVQLLPESYKARIAQIPGVTAVVHATWFGGIYQEAKNFFAQMPVEPAEFLEMYPEFVLPEEQKRAWLETRTGAIVGRKTADKYGFEIGDRVPLEATIWWRKGDEKTWEFDIVGIYDGADKATDLTQFFFRYDYFDEARRGGEGEVGWYTVRVDDPAKAAEVAAAIDERFANSPSETKAEAEKAFLQGFASQVGNTGAMIVAILGAVFFTILLVAGNTMAQSVRERTQEIGVLKAVGFSHRLVLGLVLAESVLMAFLGGLGGLALAWLMIAGGDPTGGALPVFYFPVSALVAGVALVVVFGLVTGILPAYSAMRLGTADALRRH